MIKRLNIPTLVALLVVLLSGPVTAQPSGGGTDLNLAAVDTWLLPAYRKLETATSELRGAASDYCKVSDRGNLAALQQAFARGMGAWQRIQLLRFGPVEFQLRAHRFELWPDKRGSVRRHLDQLLAAQDPAALTADNFRSGTIAVQGFSALERLIFTDPPLDQTEHDAATPKARFRCRVVETIAANLAGMSADIVREWTAGPTPFRQVIASAADGNDFFASRDEVSAKMLNGLHAELERVADQKLARPLGASLEQARGRRAESWRSGLSLDNIRHNLIGCQSLFRTAFAAPLHDAGLRDSIDQRFERTLDALDAIPGTLAAAVTDPALRPRVETLRDRAADLEALFATTVPATLGIPLGFNSLDGD